MTGEAELKQALHELFETQRLGVLGTQEAGQPYLSLVALAATADLRHLLFSTTRATRKFANLTADPRVAMQIDNRTNQEADFHQALAVTATGVVEEVSGAEKDGWAQLFLTKHPYLKEFVEAPSCALLKITVDTYYVVNRFQNVRELHLHP